MITIDTTAEIAMLTQLRNAFDLPGGNAVLQILGTVGATPNTPIASVEISHISIPVSGSMYLAFQKTSGDTTIEMEASWVGGTPGSTATATSFRILDEAGGNTILSGSVGMSANNDIQFAQTTWEYQKQIVISNLQYSIISLTI